MSTSIWDGTTGIVSGSTPFGLFDSDSDFTSNAQKFAKWAARRMGYPIVNVELQSGSFYACYEEATMEYSREVNEFQISQNLLSLQGSTTSGSVNYTHKNVASNLSQYIKIAKSYGLETGVGGDVEIKSGSIDIISGQQVYNLNALWANVSESGKRIEVKRIHHYQTPASARYISPYLEAGAGITNLLDEFGGGAIAVGASYMMMPLFSDLLRIQQVSLSDTIRRSAYGFQLQYNNLKLFPIPASNFKLWFEYILEEDRNNPTKDVWNSEDGANYTVSDMSNAPYDFMAYSNINSVGQKWINSYALALAKETLGMVRSKYQSIPIPGDETSLDGDTLRSEAESEKTALLEQLRETLDKTSRKAMMEAKNEEASFLQETMNKVPMKIYIG